MHKTVPVMVWVDIDIDIVDMVVYLNTIPGIRTLFSCQGYKKERPYVVIHWNTKSAINRVSKEFDVEAIQENVCMAYQPNVCTVYQKEIK